MTGPGRPQQYWPPQGPLPSPPRRRLGTVLAIVIGLVVVLAVGVTVYVVKSGTSSTAERFTPSKAPKAETTRPRATTPKPSTTRTRSTTPRTTTRTTVKPTPRESPADLLQRNTLYKIPALADAGCTEGAQASFDSVAGVRAFYSSVMPCLDAAWSQLRSAKLPFRAARLVVHSGEPISECGALAYSFYCSSEQTIYMYAPEMITPWQQFPTEQGRRNTRLAALHTIAHEYGHHIQHLTGIFGALGSDWPGTESERELELQASCFGNAFLGSQSSAYSISSGAFADEQYWRFITRVPNHGSVDDQKLWSDRGYEHRKPGACNTFGAPRSEVN